MSAFKGSGKIKIAPYDSGAAFGLRDFVDVGNSSAFQFSFAEDKQELRDYRDPAGGIDASMVRIESVTGQMDLRHFTASNLALALWGSTSALGTDAITGEVAKIRAGKFIPTARLIDRSQAVVLKKGETAIAAADYTVSDAGVTIAATITTEGVSEDDAITLDYTPRASIDVQALVNSAPNVSVLFEGTNGVTGKPAIGRFWKCKLGVAQNVGLIGDDFGTLQVSFTVEKDETVPGAGTSKFFALEQAA